MDKLKTYKRVIESPQLVIEYDDSPESPREWSNLGHFITCEKRYNSPDDNEELKSLIQNAGEEASNQAEHIKNIKTEMEANGYGKVLAIYPVYKYEHGSVVYRRGSASGWDYSNCGFYIITDKTLKDMPENETEWERIIDNELETYTQWCNGEVYMFTFMDENGDVLESCGGIYDIESIKEYLPDEWEKEDLSKYITQ